MGIRKRDWGRSRNPPVVFYTSKTNGEVVMVELQSATPVSLSPRGGRTFFRRVTKQSVRMTGTATSEDTQRGDRYDA